MTEPGPCGIPMVVSEIVPEDEVWLIATPADPDKEPSGRLSGVRLRRIGAGLAFALDQAERCRRADDLEGAARWEQIAAGIAAGIAEE
jgi:hypothetical protein